MQVGDIYSAEEAEEAGDGDDDDLDFFLPMSVRASKSENGKWDNFKNKAMSTTNKIASSVNKYSGNVKKLEEKGEQFAPMIKMAFLQWQMQDPESYAQFGAPLRRAINQSYKFEKKNEVLDKLEKYSKILEDLTNDINVDQGEENVEEQGEEQGEDNDLETLIALML